MAAAKAKEDAVHHVDLNASHHEVVEHPNMNDVNATPLQGVITEDKKKKKKGQGCATIMRRLDLMVIKPLLIYKYEHGTHKKQKIFNELLMMEGEKIEEFITNKEKDGGQGDNRRS